MKNLATYIGDFPGTSFEHLALDRLIRWEKLIYGFDKSRSIGQLRSCLRRFPRGIVCISSLNAERILGFVDVWPLRTEVFMKLQSGELREEDIHDGWIDSRASGDLKHWYFGGVMVDPRLVRSRRLRLAREVFHSISLELFHKFSETRLPCDLLGICSTTNGRTAAIRWDFKLDKEIDIGDFAFPRATKKITKKNDALTFNTRSRSKARVVQKPGV